MQVLKKEQAVANVEAIKVKEESLEVAGERCLFYLILSYLI